MIQYLDPSVALRGILAGPDQPKVLAWLKAQPPGSVVSSRLLRTEIVHVLRRDSLPLQDADPVLHRVRLISLSDRIATLAESITPHLKSLDALHLGTVLEIGEPLTVVTHDANLENVAQLLGFQTFDPCL